MSPSIARTIHFVASGQHHAAIITKVWSETIVDVVYWTTHPKGGAGTHSHLMAQFDGTGTTENTWHWPERA